MKLLDRLRGTPEPLRAVVVTTKTGGALKGLLAGKDGSALLLKAAQLATQGANSRITWQPLAGEVIIPRDNIEYWQQGVGIDPDLT